MPPVNCWRWRGITASIISTTPRRMRRVTPSVSWVVRWPTWAGRVTAGAYPARCISARGRTQRGLSRKHVIEACEQALKRLRVDYLDLYFCHRPDDETPVAETVWAMDTLIRQGKVLYWGTSEWPAERIREAHEVAGRHHLHAPSMEQPQYNLLHRERVEREYAPLYDEFGMGTTIWSPLASGLLTGKYAEGVPEGSRASQPGYEWLREQMMDNKAQHAAVARLLSVAADLDMSPAQMAIAWCLKNPHVSTVMLGASRPDQLRQNLEAMDAVEHLDDTAVQRIESAVNG